MTMTTKYPKIR